MLQCSKPLVLLCPQSFHLCGVELPQARHLAPQPFAQLRSLLALLRKSQTAHASERSAGLSGNHREHAGHPQDTSPSRCSSEQTAGSAEENPFLTGMTLRERLKKEETAHGTKAWPHAAIGTVRNGRQRLSTTGACPRENDQSTPVRKPTSPRGSCPHPARVDSFSLQPQPESTLRQGPLLWEKSRCGPLPVQHSPGSTSSSHCA